MIYCTSDVHGNRKAFEDILTAIDLQPSDTLFIIGDIVDRGPHGIEVLQEVMRNPNMVFLMGNHELMMLQTFTGGAFKGRGSHDLWLYNGGDVTERAFSKLSVSEQIGILDFLKNAGYERELSVNGEDFLLVHAAPGCCYGERTQSERRMSVKEFVVWHRSRPEEKLCDGKTVIFGHTPTLYFQKRMQMEIWRGEGRICIDCGAGHALGSSRLACLRLDDMKVFYADAPE